MVGPYHIEDRLFSCPLIGSLGCLNQYQSLKSLCSALDLLRFAQLLMGYKFLPWSSQSRVVINYRQAVLRSLTREREP